PRWRKQEEWGGVSAGQKRMCAIGVDLKKIAAIPSRPDFMPRRRTSVSSDSPCRVSGRLVFPVSGPLLNQGRFDARTFRKLASPPSVGALSCGVRPTTGGSRCVADTAAAIG
ncbi:MAG: hypothetical protein KDA89_21600, partial [Planctomycetaceae bacterium]|nr:hypothetical protein [Planctomycetaceae bacterium]